MYLSVKAEHYSTLEFLKLIHCVIITLQMPQSDEDTSVEMISTQEQLSNLCELLKKEKEFAVDLEVKFCGNWKVNFLSS